MFLELLVFEFNDFLVRTGSSKHTSRSYFSDLFQFLLFSKNHIGKEPKVNDLSKDLIRSFILSLNNLDSSSVSRKISSIRSFVRFLKGEGLIDDDPVMYIKNPKTKSKIPRGVELFDLKMFASSIDCSNKQGIRNRAMVELLYGCALRISEAVNLKWSDIDFDTSVVSILGKGRKERIVPLTDGSKKWLIALKNASTEKKEHVFLNRFGNKITCRSINRMFIDVCKKSGIISKITPHMIRHCIATNLLANGMNIKAIQQILGHSNIKTTSIYTSVSKALKSKALSQNHPLNFM